MDRRSVESADRTHRLRSGGTIAIGEACTRPRCAKARASTPSLMTARVPRARLPNLTAPACASRSATTPAAIQCATRADACVEEQALFDAAPSSPAGGRLVPRCNPLDDNDIDGSGSAVSRRSSACGSATIRLLRAPQPGHSARTAFTCMPEGITRHRCTIGPSAQNANGCADADNGTIDVNSCNQGYVPLFRESTANSTVCDACDVQAARATPATAAATTSIARARRHIAARIPCARYFGSGEECQYLWASEIDGQRPLVAVAEQRPRRLLRRSRRDEFPALPGSARRKCSMPGGRSRRVSSQLANPQMLRRWFVTDVRLLREAQRVYSGPCVPTRIILTVDDGRSCADGCWRWCAWRAAWMQRRIDRVRPCTPGAPPTVTINGVDLDDVEMHAPEGLCTGRDRCAHSRASCRATVSR